jgi:hypothetical protein
MCDVRKVSVCCLAMMLCSAVVVAGGGNVFLCISPEGHSRLELSGDSCCELQDQAGREDTQGAIADGPECGKCTDTSLTTSLLGRNPCDTQTSDAVKVFVAAVLSLDSSETAVFNASNTFPQITPHLNPCARSVVLIV